MQQVIPMALAMKDGSVVYLDELGFGDWSEDRYTERDQGLRGHWCFTGFEQVVDVDEIEGVLFGGMYTNEMINDQGMLVYRPAREDMVEVKLK